MIAGRCIMWTVKDGDANKIVQVCLNEDAAKNWSTKYVEEQEKLQKLEWKLLSTIDLDDEEARNLELTGFFCRTVHRNSLHLEPHVVRPIA